MVARHRNARRVDLRVTRVGEQRPALVGAVGGRHVAADGVGAEVKRVRVAAGGQHDRIGRVRLDFAGFKVPCDDPACPAVDHYQVEHLGPGVHLHRAVGDLSAERLVRAEQQLLPGLAAAVERAGHLRAAETAVVELAAVLARERHALRHTLVDDVDRHFREAVDVGLAAAEVAALDGVVKQAVDAVAVVLVVLRGVDAALGGDRVRPAGGVVEAERRDLVAQLGKGGARARPGQAGADHDHAEYLRLLAGLTSFWPRL